MRHLIDLSLFVANFVVSRSFFLSSFWLVDDCSPSLAQSTPGITGFFEVTVNGELVHSKKNGEGFPNDAKIGQIAAKIQSIA